jgi:hypothetical protein
MAGLLCSFGMLAFLYMTGRRLAGEAPARISVLPIFVFLCFTSFTDYVHYTSEQVSIFLIGWAIFELTQVRRYPCSFGPLVRIGLIVGLLPFAKLQSIVPAAALGLLAAWLVVRRPHFSASVLARWGVLALTALLPGLVLLSIVATAGAFHDFWMSYVETGSSYGTHFESLASDVEAKADVIALALTPLWDMTASIYLMLNIGGVVAACLLGRTLSASRTSRDWYVASVFLTAATIITVVFVNNPFLHYTYYLLPALCLLTLASFRILRVGLRRLTARRLKTMYGQASLASLGIILFLGLFIFTYHAIYRKGPDPTIAFFITIIPALLLASAFAVGAVLKVDPSRDRRQQSAIFIGFTAFFLIPASLLAFSPNRFQGHIDEYLTDRYSEMDLAIRKFSPTGGRLAIWGWAPEMIAETGIPLGTRDPITQYALPPGPLQPYYRQRYLQDLKQNQPALFLEATGPHNHAFNNPGRDGIASFPELNSFISDHYRQVATIDGMRLFLWSNPPPLDSATKP